MELQQQLWEEEQRLLCGECLIVSRDLRFRTLSEIFLRNCPRYLCITIFLTARKAEVLAIICAKESLKVTEPQYKLTPLHLAVIVKNIDIVRILLENGAEVNTRDANGWTALHHAMVLGDEAIITLLKEKGAADDILDPRNGTPADLYSLVHGKVDPMAQHFFYRKKGDVELRLGTGADFYTLTGKKLSTEMLSAEGDLYHSWSRYFGRPPGTPDALPSPNPLMAMMILDITNEMYRKVMKPSRDDNPCFLAEDAASGGFTLRARRTIKTGEIVAFYTGHSVPRDLTDAEYEEYLRAACRDEPTCYDSTGLLNHDRRCIASFGDDSFPNVLAWPALNILGLSKITGYVACVDIREGDKICRHYSGTHSVKLNARLELRPKAMHRFAAEFLADLMVCDRVLNNERSSALERSGLHTQLLYLCSTKLSLFQLFANGLISATNMDILMEVLGEVESLSSRPDIEAYHRCFLEKITMLSKIEDKLTPTMRECYNKLKEQLRIQLEERAFSLDELLKRVTKFCLDLMKESKLPWAILTP